MECNGKKDCPDNSDELTINCHRNGNTQTDTVSGNCTKFAEFQCNSGKCIPIELLCDGEPNCDDNSDETRDRCFAVYCPQFAFQCDYGACVSGEAKCNRRRDCIDASDETFELCNYVFDESIVPITVRPTTKPPMVIINRLPEPGQCVIPRVIDNVRIIVADGNLIFREGDIVDQFTPIRYECDKKNYVLNGVAETYCISGEWQNPSPVCTSE